MNDSSLTCSTLRSNHDTDSDAVMLDWSAGEDWVLPLPISIECFARSQEARGEDPASDWNPL
jgi:hypothetical protein